MAKAFKCPSCGAPLDYDGSNRLTVQCPFCANVVIVPEELRSAKNVSAPVPTQAAPAEPVLDNPYEIKAKIKENRRAARAKRRELRHQLRKLRRQDD